MQHEPMQKFAVKPVAVLGCFLGIAGVVWADAQPTTLIQCLALGGDGVLWAGTFGQGLLVSKDFGRTWSDVKLPEGAGSRVLAASADIFAVVIGTESTGLWVLPENGTWHRAANVPPSASVETVFRSGDGTWWAGTWDDGIWWSQGADSWQPVLNWSSPGAASAGAAVGTTILVGTTGDGLHRSTDHGSSWEKVATIPARANVAAIVPTSARGAALATAEGEVFRSDDEGTAWRKVGTCAKDGGVVHQMLVSKDAWWASTSKGITSSRDQGKTWSEPKPLAGKFKGAVLIGLPDGVRLAGSKD